MFLTSYLKSMGDNFGLVTSLPFSIYRSSQPSFSKLVEYKDKYNISTILNLRDDLSEKDLKDEESEVLNSGMNNFFHIPLSDKKEPSRVDILDCLDILVSRSFGNILIHCKGGRHRTSLIIACYRTQVNWWTKEKAWAENEKYGWYDEFGHKILKEWFFGKF